MIGFDKKNEERLRRDWADPRLDSRLRFLVWALVGFVSQFRKDLIITSIFRPDPGSVHGHWRGIDARSSIFSSTQRQRILAFTNQLRYDRAKPELDTAIHHNVGQGWHFHLQTNSGAETILVKVNDV